MYQTVSLFASVGEGTLAPWDPPRELVVQGVYRHVCNPMVSGVLFILLEEATLLGSLPLLLWFLIFFAVNAAYIPLLEERQLVRRFGGEYLTYKRNVPRWIARLNPGRRDQTIDGEITLDEPLVQKGFRLLVVGAGYLRVRSYSDQANMERRMREHS